MFICVKKKGETIWSLLKLHFFFLLVIWLELFYGVVLFLPTTSKKFRSLVTEIVNLQFMVFLCSFLGFSSRLS